MATTSRRLVLPTIEGWLWDAACRIRGAVDAPKYKDYILPLIFLKRLSESSSSSRASPRPAT